MVNPGTLLVGPLAGPECRRAVARGWLIVVRALAAAALMGAALIALWLWWFNRQYIDDLYQPLGLLRTAVLIVESMALMVVLVMAPAVLAGSLAGERERGALGLLLTTRVSSREIILGRVLGKLSQVAMVLLASMPAVLLLGGLAGLPPSTHLVLWTLPLAIAVGGGGMAALASTLARRGRDALLAVYLCTLLCLVAPLLESSGTWTGTAATVVGALNPFIGLGPLIWDGKVALALISIGLWVGMGVLGITVAAWRLRPTCLGPRSGDRIGRSGKRRGWVPPLDDRPMLWKELFIERVGTLGRAGWWLGALYVLIVGGGSVVVAALYGYALWWRHDLNSAKVIQQGLTLGGESGLYLSFLLQWAIGLRAAATIASERERGTWDALLTSPLDGREIVRGKLWGTLYALRWLAGSTFLAWTLAVACEAMSLSAFVSLVAMTVTVGAFMAAVGVRASLAVSTASRATAWTIGLWLGGWVVDWIVSGILFSIIMLLWMFCWAAAAQMGLTTSALPLSAPLTAGQLWGILTNGTFLVATLLIVSDTRLRFDRIAGRMTEGRVSVVLDRMIYGGPTAPVLMPEPAKATPSDAPPKSGDPDWEEAYSGPP